ncbi:hypothetical protein BH10BAC3_BH10BAC3_10870 [soil metagenome]
MNTTKNIHPVLKNQVIKKAVLKEAKKYEIH